MNTLIPLAGTSRTLASEIKIIKEPWVGIPFGGGLAELPFIQSPTVLVNDHNEAIITLADAVKNSLPELQAALREQLFHPTTLKRAQEQLDTAKGLDLAVAFFTACWMTRSGADPATSPLSIRWKGGGGDSNKRYRSAIDALPEWCETFRRCTFVCMDAMDFLKKAKTGFLYCDPPQQEFWHQLLVTLPNPMLIRATGFESFYPSDWERSVFPSRSQTNEVMDEVLVHKPTT